MLEYQKKTYSFNACLWRKPWCSFPWVGTWECSYYTRPLCSWKGSCCKTTRASNRGRRMGECSRLTVSSLGIFCRLLSSTSQTRLIASICFCSLPWKFRPFWLSFCPLPRLCFFYSILFWTFLKTWFTNITFKSL